MYTAYTNEISEEDLLYEPSERTSDIQLPPIINTLILVTWVAIFLVGFLVIYLVKSHLLGALILAIPTFIGMVIESTFAPCTMMNVGCWDSKQDYILRCIGHHGMKGSDGRFKNINLL